MDADRLGELAKDVRELLKTYDIPAENFVLKILVSREYYETIKENSLIVPLLIQFWV